MKLAAYHTLLVLSREVTSLPCQLDTLPYLSTPLASPASQSFLCLPIPLVVSGLSSRRISTICSIICACSSEESLSNQSYLLSTAHHSTFLYFILFLKCLLNVYCLLHRIVSTLGRSGNGDCRLESSRFTVSTPA